MTQYCNLYRPSSVYPDMKKLREVLTQLSDQQKLDILQQKYSGKGYPFWRSALYCAAVRDDTEIISTLLTSIQSSADRLKLLMVDDKWTPLHEATCWVHTDSVKMILNCLTANQQIQIMSVQIDGMTAIQMAERRGQTVSVRVLREYQHKAYNLMQRRREQRINEEKTRQRLSGINDSFGCLVKFLYT